MYEYICTIMYLVLFLYNITSKGEGYIIYKFYPF